MEIKSSEGNFRKVEGEMSLRYVMGGDLPRDEGMLSAVVEEK